MQVLEPPFGRCSAPCPLANRDRSMGVRKDHAHPGSRRRSSSDRRMLPGTVLQCVMKESCAATLRAGINRILIHAQSLRNAYHTSMTACGCWYHCRSKCNYVLLLAEYSIVKLNEDDSACSLHALPDESCSAQRLLSKSMTCFIRKYF